MTDMPPEPASPQEPAAQQPAAQHAATVVASPNVAAGGSGQVPVQAASPVGSTIPAQPGVAGWVQGPGGWVRVPLAGPPRQVPPSVFQRYWPGPAGTAAAPRISISLIVVAAVVAAIGLVPGLPGFGWFLTAVALAAISIATTTARKPAPAVAPSRVTDAENAVDTEVAASVDTETAAAGTPTNAGTGSSAAADPVRRTREWKALLAANGERLFWGACTLALVGVGTFRAAGWLFFWCVVFAFGSGAMALAGGRTVRALFAAVWSPVMAPFRSPPWIVRGLRRTRTDGARIVVASAVSVLLLLVFGGLFASADAEFRHVLGSLLPPLRASEVARAIFCFIVVGAVGCGVAFLAAARPKYDALTPMPAKPVRRAEWVLPLTVLNILFAVFVFIQLTVLFGGDPNLVNASHDYMRGYAHNGFWQLLVVSLLTLTVLLVTGRIAPRATATDRALLRILLGGLAVFSIVIVASALKRVATYESAYGYTRLRVAVAGIELWFGLLFVLILIAGITLRAAWLPRVIVGSLVCSLLAGAIANPDEYVARRNVDRYQSTGKLSIEYMQKMSADALPAIERLPPTLRACALERIATQVESRGDDWRTWNFSRVAARNAVADYLTPANGSCPELVR